MPTPFIDAAQFAELTEVFGEARRIDFTFPAATGVPGARRAVAQIATTPLSSGGRPGFLLLSDRGIGKERACLPALLATAALWKAMVREGLWDVPLVVESAQIFDTHHVALLVAAGASAVLPYLADQFAEALESGGAERVRSSVNAGLRKVLARMGVSTIASYRNSQLFEVVGLSEDLCAEFFEDAADFPGQKSLDELLADYLRMHEKAFAATADDLGDAGLYRFRKGAELHANSPELVRRMHAHVRAPDAKKYSALEELAERQGTVFLRDLLDIVPGTPIADGGSGTCGIGAEAFQHAGHVARFSGSGGAPHASGGDESAWAGAAIPGKAAKIRRRIATSRKRQTKSSRWRPDDLE